MRPRTRLTVNELISVLNRHSGGCNQHKCWGTTGQGGKAKGGGGQSKPAKSGSEPPAVKQPGVVASLIHKIKSLGKAAKDRIAFEMELLGRVSADSQRRSQSSPKEMSYANPLERIRRVGEAVSKPDKTFSKW